MEKLNFRVYPYYTGNDDAHEGSPYEDDWQLDDQGVPYIAGQINVDEMIQSYARECDINVVIAQHLALGDLSSLAYHSDDSKVVDVSGVPDDLNTLNNKRRELYSIYSSLNTEQKKLFSGFDDFVINFNKLFKQVEKPEESEVNNNES